MVQVVGAAPGPALDGRVARGEQTRRSVAASLLALVEEGDLRPTVERVADRAGVSVRSIFHHFRDREDLLATVVELHVGRMSGTLGRNPAEGPLPDRIRALVAHRSGVYEKAGRIRHAAALEEPFSETVASVVGRTREAHRADLARVFAAELEPLPRPRRAEVLACLDAASSWDLWHQLRWRQRLPLATARRVVRTLVRGALAGATTPVPHPKARS